MTTKQITRLSFRAPNAHEGSNLVAQCTIAVREWSKDRKPIDTEQEFLSLVCGPKSITCAHPEHSFHLDLAPHAAALKTLTDTVDPSDKRQYKPHSESTDPRNYWARSAAIQIDGWSLVVWTEQDPKTKGFLFKYDCTPVTRFSGGPRLF